MQNYNIIQDTVDISDESGPVEEPVTLAEIKNYLRLNGFVDDNDSTPIDDFNDDDVLIQELITTARQTLEVRLNISIVNHTWRATGVTNHAGNVQLKYGPVKEIAEILDSNDEAYEISAIKNRGDFLAKPCDSNMTVKYTAGFENVPSPIVTEIKRMVAYMYENRGDTDGLEGYKYSHGVMNYSRKEILF